MKRLISILAVAALFAVPARADDVQIEIKDHAFVPATIDVPVGAIVTWINRDQDPHNVVDKSQTFRSEALETDGTYAHVFDKPGVDSVFASDHFGLLAEIQVEPS